MSAPYNIDNAIMKILSAGMPTGVPVYKSEFLPSEDLTKMPKGYVFFDVSNMTPALCSEGYSEPNGRESVDFLLDVSVVHHENAQRKSLQASVLNVLQPTVSGRRTILTSHNVQGTGVFLNYIRMESVEEGAVLKTAQSTPDLAVLMMSFSGKAST